MAAGDEKDDLWTSIATDIRDAVVIVVALAALAAVTWFIVNHYDDAKDASSVLGVIVPAISTLGAAAFGVAAGVKVGTAAARWAARGARVQLANAQLGFKDLRDALEPVLDAAAASTRQATSEQLDEARGQLIALERSLRG